MRTLSVSVSDYRVTDTDEIVAVDSSESRTIEYDAMIKMTEYV